MGKRIISGAVLLLFALTTAAVAQKDRDDLEPTCWIHFTVVRDENGKPVRNAAVVMHPVNTGGKQERGGMELKTNPEGKADYDGVPYGKLRVQVLAPGFQTYGEDFDIDKDKAEITVKLKRPQGQYSVYDDHPTEPAKTNPPPSDAKKPN